MTQKLGGEVRCESQPGRGATFTLTLPQGGRIHMTDDKDELLFLGDDEAEHKLQDTPVAWKLIIVDDEAEVHNVTRLCSPASATRGAGLSS